MFSFDRRLESMVENLFIQYRPFGYNMSYSVGIFDSFPDQIDWSTLKVGSRCLAIYDKKVDSFARVVHSKLSSYNFEVVLLPLDIGKKDLGTVEQIWTAMTTSQPDFAVAIGGGTTCDMVGFASSCYRRGI